MNTVKPSNYNSVQRAQRLAREIEEGAQRARECVIDAVGSGDAAKKRALTMALKSIRERVAALEKLRQQQAIGLRG